MEKNKMAVYEVTLKTKNKTILMEAKDNEDVMISSRLIFGKGEVLAIKEISINYNK